MGKIVKNPLLYIFLLFLQFLFFFSFFNSSITNNSNDEIYALNKVNYWDFASATGWTGTNDNGTNICGDNNSSTGDLAFSTAAVTSGTFQAVTPCSSAAKIIGAKITGETIANNMINEYPLKKDFTLDID